jgi:hypothetical protein
MSSDLIPSWQHLERLLATPYAYIVAFRLTGPSEAYQDFYKLLKDSDEWFSYTPNMWIVTTRISLIDLSAGLRAKIRTADWLIVMPAKGPADGWLPAAGWEWLNRILPREW